MWRNPPRSRPRPWALQLDKELPLECDRRTAEAREMLALKGGDRVKFQESRPGLAPCNASRLQVEPGIAVMRPLIGV